MQQQFEKIASFQYTAEAMILKGRLEADGVEVFMANNNTIDTDPLMSNAIGGVQLYVNTADVDKAHAVMAEISRYAVDNAGKPVQCPNCGSDRVDVMSTVRDRGGFAAFVLGLFLSVLPFFIKYKYHCSNCGHEFEIK
ncbi:MAG: putative signal transducing protein [Bacteroidia bacterium]